MGKTTGFMEYPRIENPYRNVHARLQDFEELHMEQPENLRRCQAARCMDCGVPFCQSDYGCPLHNLIPEWNDLLYQGQEKEALKRLLFTAPFPEFTGRVCPALCEKACNLADDGVTNRDNELYLVEKGFDHNWIQPRIPAFRTGKRIAVIGSGPSGLAAADLLNQMGHMVTVFERADRPGGLLMYGIPNMKLPKKIIERRIRLMEAEGVSFTLNTSGNSDLLDMYDAVLLCCGFRKPRTLNIMHMDADGVCFAVDYLTAATRGIMSAEMPGITACGKHVVVIGGGDTGTDCVGTALRQGCKSITQLEMRPKLPENRAAWNPWPEWPGVLRTDYGQVEAAVLYGNDPRIYESTVKSIQVDSRNRITAVEMVRIQKMINGDIMPVNGSEETLPCDMLLIAAGFIGCEGEVLSDFSLASDKLGKIRPEDNSHHLKGNLFSAGDMRNGQSLVVRALADGRMAAKEIHEWFGKEK